MKKLILVLNVVLLIFGIGGIADAMPYTITDITYFTATGTNAAEDYVDHGRGDVNILDGIGDYVTWQHQYTFSPPLGAITSATIEISVQDDEADNPSNYLGSYELGGGIAESGEWSFGEVDTGTYGYDLDGSYLGDGSFFVTIGSLWGDFTILSSILTINYDSADKTAPVPEPASLLLLGTGLIGMAALGRKRLLKG